jgi:GDP-4-dehydro-6-deoxy-D-mannose reductase
VTAAASGVPLVTGAAGFAGSHLLERLLRTHAAVAAWSNPGSTRPRPALDGVHWNAVDLLDTDAVERELDAVQPSVIFHCAGLPHVGQSWAQAARALRVNAFATSRLLDAVSRTSPKCVVVVTGSAFVYRPAASPLREDDALGPSDPYGVSKLAQELAGLQTDVHVVLTRPFNHAGPRQPSSFVTSTFARQIAEIEAGRRQALRVGNLDARRDITDVRDTVRAYEILAAKGRPSRPYNICSGVAHRVGDLLEMLLGMASIRVDVQQDPDRMRPSDNPLVLGDPSRIQTEIGWRAEIPIDQTLSDLLDWWRGQIAAEAGSEG